MKEAAVALLLAVAALAAPAVGFGETRSIELWQFVTYGGAFYLGVGLVRDLWLRLRRGRCGASCRAGEKLLCLESSGGVVAIAAGLGLLFLGVERSFATSPRALLFVLSALVLVNGLTKDFVLVVRRQPDHDVIPW